MTYCIVDVTKAAARLRGEHYYTVHDHHGKTVATIKEQNERFYTHGRDYDSLLAACLSLDKRGQFEIRTVRWIPLKDDRPLRPPKDRGLGIGLKDY